LGDGVPVVAIDERLLGTTPIARRSTPAVVSTTMCVPDHRSAYADRQRRQHRRRSDDARAADVRLHTAVAAG
jgi:hypothetical protein